ncbi:stage II sporulation protein M [Paenibacillus turpanensis]|uniref:stage II sporulation protein M n=1 Tax=Paenibacillus turpanensis TaxID=2689078 RepID=UPI00140CDF66|nr:stage II sporulation protein M [Paenibacillus turpanensis]
MLANSKFQLFHKDQLPLYIFVGVLFLMGVVFGSLMVNAMSLSQKEELSLMMNSFFHMSIQGANGAGSGDILHYFGTHAKWIGLIWLFGLSVVGLPLILLLDFLKGVLIGFTVGFMASEFSWDGMVFALASVAPQNMLLIPALLIASVAALSFSIQLVKVKFMQQRGTVGEPFAVYSAVTVLMIVVTMGAALMQAYVSPVIIGWTAPIVSALVY